MDNSIDSKTNSDQNENTGQINESTLVSSPTSDSDEEINFDEMPHEVKKTVQAFLGMASRHSSGNLQLWDKFNDNHIDKYLDYVQRDDDNEFHLRKTNRWFYLAYILIAVIVFCIGVVYLLEKDRELLNQLITFLILIAGGVGTGYGLSKRK